MINEILMKPGDWTWTLKPETPFTIRGAPQYFGLMVVTPTPVADRGISRANLLAQSIYTGIIRRRSDGWHTFGGPGILAWAGDEQSKGVQIAGGYVPTDWAGMINALFNTGAPAGVYVNQLSAAAVMTNPVPTVTTAVSGTSRHIMEEYARQLGAEYRIKPDGQLIHGQIGQGVFKGYPKVCFMADDGGFDLNMTGWKSKFTIAGDVDSVISSIYCSSGAFSGTGTPAVSVNFSDFASGATNATLTRNITINNAGSNADCGKAAQGEADTYNWERLAISARFNAYAPTRMVVPGDQVFVWNPKGGIISHANTVGTGNPTAQTHFRGRMIFPIFRQLAQLSWPVETPRMGVYVISSDRNAKITNMSDWIVSEAGRESTALLGPVPHGIGSAFAQTATRF